MKKLALLTLILGSLFAGIQAKAAGWLWAGESPWVYNNDDGQWYYMQAYDSAVWLFGTNAVELAPPAGNAPATMANRRMEVAVIDEPGSAIFVFNADNTYSETNPDGSFTGEYRYSKTGNDSAMMVLFENDDIDITVVEFHFATASSGTLEAVTAGGFEREEVSGSFTLE